MRQPTPKQFLADVAAHQMTVRHEDGIYRHIRFKKPNSYNMYFDLVTWPGYLNISGDMGTWTFARLEDMFEFFRCSEGLKINPYYWSEKLKHGNYQGRDGAKVYDDDLFRERLKEQLTDYYSLEGDELRQISGALEEEVLSQDCKYDLLIAARDFNFRFDDGRTFKFDCCELPDGEDYSYHFIWCCYAIVWGIQQWDARAAAKQGLLEVWERK